MKIIFVIIFINTESVEAQDLKLAGVEYFNYGNSRINNLTNNNELYYQGVGLFVNIPTVLKNKKTILINGLRYDFLQSSVHFSDSDRNKNSDFQMISYNLRIIQQFKNNWIGSSFLSFALASDFKSPISYNDFVLRGGITVSKKLNEKLIIGGGILANNNILGSPPVLPLFQLTYNKNRQQLLVYFPAIAEYNYKFGLKQKIKFGGRITFNGYYFNYLDNENVSLSTADKVSNSVANIGPIFSYKITNSLQMETFGGLSTMRTYKYKDLIGNEMKFHSQTSPFFQIGFNFTAPGN